MDNNKFQIEVLQRLTAIETTLKQLDYKAIVETLSQLEKKVIKVEEEASENDERISRIEDNGKWLWRTVAGSIVLALLALIFKI